MERGVGSVTNTANAEGPRWSQGKLHQNLKTLAEGVETLGQLNGLRDKGCTEVQGYFFGSVANLRPSRPRCMIGGNGFGVTAGDDRVQG